MKLIIIIIILITIITINNNILILSVRAISSIKDWRTDYYHKYLDNFLEIFSL